MVITDAWGGYNASTSLAITILPVLESSDPRLSPKNTCRSSTLFSATSRLGFKARITARQPKHLQAYLNEFTFRFNRRFYPFNAFRSLLGIGTNGEGPTYDGLYDGTWKHATMASHHD